MTAIIFNLGYQIAISAKCESTLYECWDTHQRISSKLLHRSTCILIIHIQLVCQTNTTEVDTFLIADFATM